MTATQTIDNTTLHQCRICHELDSDSDSEMIAPCHCKGTMRWVHESCLAQWRHAQRLFGGNWMCCSDCKADYMTSAASDRRAADVTARDANTHERFHGPLIDARSVGCTVVGFCVGMCVGLDVGDAVLFGVGSGIGFCIGTSVLFAKHAQSNGTSVQSAIARYCKSVFGE